MKYLAMAAALGAGFAVELAAQPVEQQRQRVRQVVVYGNDPCPRGTGDEIIVCARRPETERFRLPPDARDPAPGPGSEAWQNRARALDEAQEAGIGSCTAVGPGGSTGCLQEQIDAHRAEREAAEGGDPPRL